MPWRFKEVPGCLKVVHLGLRVIPGGLKGSLGVRRGSIKISESQHQSVKS